METRKLLIADGSEEFRNALALAFQSSYRVRLCADGPEALAMLRSFRPDILVLDLMIPGLDGISLLHAALADDICPVVLATCRFMTEYISESVEKLGISYVMIKPCNIQAMEDRVRDLTQRIHPAPVSCPDPRDLISNTLTTLSFLPNLDGARYLREAILLMAKDPNQAMTKELYPAVGAIFGRSAQQVERSIRNAINRSWLLRDDRIWQQYFPSNASGTVPRPSNAQFICRLAEKLLLHQEDD